MRSGTTIERRITAIEQLPQPSAFDPTVPRDPRTMTSEEIARRKQELEAKAIRLGLRAKLGREPEPSELSPALETFRVAREARLDVLAATLAHPPGTTPETIAAYVRRKAESRARRLAELGTQSDEQEDDDA